MPSNGGGNIVEQLQVNIEATSIGVNTAVDDIKTQLISLNDVLTTLGNNYSYTQNLANLGIQFRALGQAVGTINAGDFKTVADSIGYLGKSTVTNAAANIPRITAGLNGLANVSGKFPDLSGLSNVLNSISVFGSSNAKVKKAITNITDVSKALQTMSSISDITAPDLSWLGTLADSIHKFGLSKTEKAYRTFLCWHSHFRTL